MKSLFTILSAVAFPLLLASAGTVQAETAWTGCVTQNDHEKFDKPPPPFQTPGGTITRLNQGPSPATPCGPDEIIIRLHEGAGKQTPDANYDQAAICDAFHYLGLQTSDMDKLGCPRSRDHTKPGTLTQVKSSHFESNDYNICGILKVEQAVPPAWQYVIPGGYEADNFRLDSRDDASSTTCETQCKDDDRCIAAQWSRPAPASGYRAGTCVHIYHTDSPEVNPLIYNCGLAPGTGFGGCAANAVVSNTWWVRVPDGQTIGHCPGTP